MSRIKSDFEALHDQNSAREIAEKVNYLFDSFRKPDGHKYNFTEVEEATGIHKSWLSKLAAGHVYRPGLQTLKALTKFFPIDPGFWFKDLEEWIIEREQAEALAKPLNLHEVIEFNLKAKGASPHFVEFLVTILESYDKLLEKEKLV